MKIINKQFLMVSVLASFISGCASNNTDITWCQEKVPKIEVINLSADALFRFDQYREKDLLAKGKNILDKLVAQITQDYASIDKIVLIGHTDRLGSKAYNQSLGLKRAKTIGTYFINKGMKVQYDVRSVGESQPATDGCYNVRQKKALIACLQPDRRVTVTIAGTKNY